MSCNLGIFLAKVLLFLNCDNFISSDFFSYANKILKTINLILCNITKF